MLAYLRVSKVSKEAKIYFKHVKKRVSKSRKEAFLVNVLDLLAC